MCQSVRVPATQLWYVGQLEQNNTTRISPLTCDKVACKWNEGYFQVFCFRSALWTLHLSFYPSLCSLSIQLLSSNCPQLLSLWLAYPSFELWVLLAHPSPPCCRPPRPGAAEGPFPNRRRPSQSLGSHSLKLKCLNSDLDLTNEYEQTALRPHVQTETECLEEVGAWLISWCHQLPLGTLIWLWITSR